MTSDGLLSRTHDDKPPRLSGVEAPRLLVKANANDTLFLVASRGQAAAVAVHTIPEAGKLADGIPFNKLSPLQADEPPAAAFSLPARKSVLPEETCVLTVTRGGMVKKSLVSDLPGPSAQTFKLVNVNDGDGLGWVALTDGTRELLLVTALGMCIRFSEEDVRPMGMVAAGVNAIKLGVGDEVIGAQLLPAPGEVFLVASDGKAKRVELKDFPSQGRYGKGVIAWELPRGIKLAGVALGKANTLVTLHLLKAASKMARLDEATLRKRAAVRGDAVVEVKPGDPCWDLTEAWSVEKYISLEKKEEKKGQKKSRPK